MSTRLLLLPVPAVFEPRVVSLANLRARGRRQCRARVHSAAFQYGGFLHINLRGLQAVTLFDGHRDSRAIFRVEQRKVPAVQAVEEPALETSAPIHDAQELAARWIDVQCRFQRVVERKAYVGQTDRTAVAGVVSTGRDRASA